MACIAMYEPSMLFWVDEGGFDGHKASGSTVCKGDEASST